MEDFVHYKHFDPSTKGYRRFYQRRTEMPTKIWFVQFFFFNRQVKKRTIQCGITYFYIISIDCR